MLSCRIRLLLTASMAAACSDYNFKEHAALSDPGELEDTAAPVVDEPSVGAPNAVVSPSSVDLGIVCERGSAEVVVENDGDAELEVLAIDTNSPDWTATHDALPVRLGPGDQLVISLTGAPVDTTLRIATSDPAHPELTVPLTGTADQPPVLAITAPAADAVLDAGAVTTFSASVSDDSGPADSVRLLWESDVDGPLDTGSADGAGVATMVWDAAARSSGTHVVTLSATDTCGHTTQADVVVCQNEGYLADNLDLSTWNFEGSALWDSANSWVELTAPVNTQSGTAFQTAATVDAANVQVEFEFYASGGTGADGLSVTAIDAARMTSFVGSTGGGIGYQGLPGWSIEVDTWYNHEHYDPTEADHLSVHIDGNINAPVVWAALPEMEDGNWHRMAVSVVGTWMTVAIDGVTYIDQDVPEITSFPAYVGFTAATGGSTNYHLVDALEVEEFVCE